MGVFHTNCCLQVRGDKINDLNTVYIFKEESPIIKVQKKVCENNENKSSSIRNYQINVETSALEKQKEIKTKFSNQTILESKKIDDEDNNKLNVNDGNVCLTRMNSKSIIRKIISISLNDNNYQKENNENTEEDLILYKRRNFRSKSSVHSKVKTNLNNFKMKYEELVSRLPVKKSNATVLFTPDNNMINLINTSPEKNNAQLNPNFKTITRGKTTQNPRKDIEIIDTPLTEKQVKTLKNILIKN